MTAFTYLGKSRLGMKSEDMTPEQPVNSHLADLNNLSCNEDYWSIVELPLRVGSDMEAPQALPPHLPQFLVELEELDEESGLHMLLCKELETNPNPFSCYQQADLSLITPARQEALHWILAVNSHHAFSAFTAALSVNYLDRFLPDLHFRRGMTLKPWMVQLSAVACLSLAAKVAETCVPGLLDLQAEKSNYVFSGKSIQKMELLVLSLLDWKMNPVIPLSFLSYIIKKIPMADRKHMEFSSLFEHFSISLLSDLKFVHYRSSTVAAATALHVMKEMEFGGEHADYCKNELCRAFQLNKENVESCYQLILTSNVERWARSQTRPASI